MSPYEERSPMLQLWQDIQHGSTNTVSTEEQPNPLFSAREDSSAVDLLDRTDSDQSEDNTSKAVYLRGIATFEGFNLLQDLPKHLSVELFRHLVGFLDHKDLLTVRALSKVWKAAIQAVHPLRFPAVYHLPVEILQQIFARLDPMGFHCARRSCKSWYYSSLEIPLLRQHLAGIGFGEADQSIKNAKSAFYLSRRLSREFSLGADCSGTCDLRNVAVFDMSDISSATAVHFTVSNCGSHVLLCEGCYVYVYRLQSNLPELMEFVACIVCPRRVLAVSMDTSSRRYSVAILLDGRIGLVHDIVDQEAQCIFKNLCSEEDAPRSVAICPQRRCVAFGCHGGIELHWVDALTGRGLNRWFPLTAPTDFLYFLPPRRGIDSAKKLRLISSAAHPEEVNPLVKRFGINIGSIAYWGTAWEPHSGQSDHFHAVPLSDGYHILFTDPSSGMLCLGSDAPLGGPTKLLRKIWLIPPEFRLKGKKRAVDLNNEIWMKLHDEDTRNHPSIYASGADVQHGVRVVAGFNERVVLFSIPPDTFSKVGGYSNSRVHAVTPPTGENSGITGRSMVPPEGSNVIHGCYIDTVPGLIDLAVDSGPAMTVYAFSSMGIMNVYKLSDNKYGLGSPVHRMVFEENGEISSYRMTDNERQSINSPSYSERGSYYDDDDECCTNQYPLDGNMSSGMSLLSLNDIDEESRTWGGIGQGVMEWEVV